MNWAWCLRFLDLAHVIAMNSKDPSTRVGAVIANDKKLVVGMGFNGFPRGVVDSAERYNSREEKYPRIVHAEVNAILNAVAAVQGCSLFGTHFPCTDCAKVIIQSGIGHVITPAPSADMLDRWGRSFDITKSMFEEAGVDVM
ncbi:MAG: cytidine/deoxycytidylate deaminase family protein, partial [Nitrospiraceae bacterium]